MNTSLSFLSINSLSASPLISSSLMNSASRFMISNSAFERHFSSIFRLEALSVGARNSKYFFTAYASKFDRVLSSAVILRFQICSMHEEYENQLILTGQNVCFNLCRFTKSTDFGIRVTYADNVLVQNCIFYESSRGVYTAECGSRMERTCFMDLTHGKSPAFMITASLPSTCSMITAHNCNKELVPQGDDCCEVHGKYTSMTFFNSSSNVCNSACGTMLYYVNADLSISYANCYKCSGMTFIEFFNVEGTVTIENVNIINTQTRSCLIHMHHSDTYLYNIHCIDVSGILMSRIDIATENIQNFYMNTQNALYRDLEFIKYDAKLMPVVMSSINPKECFFSNVFSTQIQEKSMISVLALWSSFFV